MGRFKISLINKTEAWEIEVDGCFRLNHVIDALGKDESVDFKRTLVNNLGEDFVNNNKFILGEGFEDDLHNTYVENLLNKDFMNGYISTFNNISVGDKFLVNMDTCEDGDVVEWYWELKDKTLIAKEVDMESYGVWVEDCPYRIDLGEIIKVLD